MDDVGIAAAHWRQIHYHPDGLYLRCEDSGAAIEGSTCFFRYPELFDQLIDHLDATRPNAPRLLFAPSSIGCEPYSFVMRAVERGAFDRHPGLQVDTFDINERYAAIARAGLYPRDIAAELGPARLGAHFNKVTHRHKIFHQLKPELRHKVTVHRAQDIAAYAAPRRPYDVAVCLNLLIHLQKQPDQQAEILANLLRSASAVCINHVDSLTPGVLRQAFALAGTGPEFATLDATLRPRDMLNVAQFAAYSELCRRDRTDNHAYICRPA